MGEILKIVFYFSLSHGAVPGGTSATKGMELVTRSVGEVAGEVVTSREVKINSLIEDKLYRSESPKQIHKAKTSQRAFVQETTAVLLEKAIAQEGLRFPVAKVENAALNNQIKRAEKELKSNPVWKSLAVQDSELESILKDKMSAKNFIRFKVDSAALPVTDQEALEYYNKNKFKFEKMPFESFKGNIKSFLNKRRVDARLREWFEVLQIKYSIRNHLNEDSHDS